MIIQGDNIIVNGNTTSGANIAKFDDYISVDVNNRVSTTDMIATQSFRIGDDAHWKIRPNNSNQELCFEYGTSNVMSDANIKARFNSSGHLLNPNQPGFRACLSGSPTLSFGAIILWDSVQHNIGNCYSTSTGRFTAPVSGRYYFSHAIRFNNNGSAYTQSTMAVNGSNTFGGAYMNCTVAGTTYSTPQWNGIINLNAGDYITVAGAWSGGNGNCSGTESWFIGQLIG